MKKLTKWTALAGVGLVVLLLAVLALPTAASSSDAAPTFHGGDIADSASSEYLAEALGVTVEELQAAQQAAHEAAIQQALDEGLITQAQADALLERNGFLDRRGFKGFGGFFGPSTLDHEALLAAALNVTVEELQAAQDAAMAAQLAAAVAAGRITQEQADRIEAGRGLRTYLDEQGFRERVRSLYEEAVQQAVEAGVISQEQADAILSNGGRFGRFDGLGGCHGRGGMRGFRGFGAPGDAAPSGRFQRNGFRLGAENL